uniref:mitogen-activated protein kinase kinase kinase n=1 Tax=Tetraselmis sp. GSL018 TaxID=582737 RepID=A0A061RJH3_9CHLO
MGNFCSSIKADENKRGNGILELKPQNNGVSINSTNSATNNTQVAASETRQTPQENRGASEQLSKQRKGSGEAEVIVSCNGSKLERLAVEYLSNEVGGDREVFGDGKNKRNTCNSEGEDKASVSEHDEAEKTIRWQKGELIGAGAFGRVYLGLNLDTAELMAVKQVSISKEEDIQSEVADRLTKLEAEVNVLKQLHHPNIVRYLGTERCFHNMTLNIFLEFVPGGSIASLLQRFGTFTESVMRVYTKQILLGLDFLHKHQIMHRDIKGANILVDNSGVVKLADFGASKKIENLVTMDSGYKSIKGTPYWMAPEVIKATGHGRQADIWSVGCTVIEMATGKPPWSEFKEPMSAMYQIASSKEPPPIPEHLSPEARDFLLLCFNRVPKERPNASRLLQHPFLSQATPGGRTPPSRVAPARPPAIQPRPPARRRHEVYVQQAALPRGGGRQHCRHPGRGPLPCRPWDDGAGSEPPVRPRHRLPDAAGRAPARPGRRGLADGLPDDRDRIGHHRVGDDLGLVQPDGGADMGRAGNRIEHLHVQRLAQASADPVVREGEPRQQHRIRQCPGCGRSR